MSETRVSKGIVRIQGNSLLKVTNSSKKSFFDTLVSMIITMKVVGSI